MSAMAGLDESLFRVLTSLEAITVDDQRWRRGIAGDEGGGGSGGEEGRRSVGGQWSGEEGLEENLSWEARGVVPATAGGVENGVKEIFGLVGHR